MSEFMRLIGFKHCHADPSFFRRLRGPGIDHECPVHTDSPEWGRSAPNEDFAGPHVETPNPTCTSALPDPSVYGGFISNMFSIFWDTIEIPSPYWFLLYILAQLVTLSKNIQLKRGSGCRRDVFFGVVCLESPTKERIKQRFQPIMPAKPRFRAAFGLFFSRLSPKQGPFRPIGSGICFQIPPPRRRPGRAVGWLLNCARAVRPKNVVPSGTPGPFITGR
jgi:hypothetical protein